MVQIKLSNQSTQRITNYLISLRAPFPLIILVFRIATIMAQRVAKRRNIAPLRMISRCEIFFILVQYSKPTLSAKTPAWMDAINLYSMYKHIITTYFVHTWSISLHNHENHHGTAATCSVVGDSSPIRIAYNNNSFKSIPNQCLAATHQ